MSVPDQPKLEAHEDHLVILEKWRPSFFLSLEIGMTTMAEAARIYQYLLLLLPEHTAWLLLKLDLATWLSSSP